MRYLDFIIYKILIYMIGLETFNFALGHVNLIKNYYYYNVRGRSL